MILWSLTVCAVLVCVSAHDIGCRRVEKKTILFLLLLGAARPDRNTAETMSAAGTAVFLLAFLLAVYLLTDGAAIGGGDIRLLAAFAFLLREREMIMAMAAAAVFLMLYRAVRRENRRRIVPAAPFLSAGVTVSLFVTAAVTFCAK